jgi:hypothetical protein
VADYRLLTIWCIEAPLEQVYAVIHNAPLWPDWWSSVKNVEALSPGDPEGIDSVLRYSWKGRLPYRMVFQVRTTHIERLVAIEGTVKGDLEGIGRWNFINQEGASLVHHEWYVRSTRWWMNLLSPVARSLFISNHDFVMRQGAEGLAARLEAPLLSQMTIDLMSRPPRRDAEARVAGEDRPGALTGAKRSRSP